ncbi:molybdopterin-dependent oxidoreductase [Salinisphaera hydrothermalis]|uniref:Oxidoreductase n=1 Tax=Salinisphaera hydrothermalis (strain C41B8) TaxID=1304275 RepID=A0A084IGC1_SALHC|nr:molybdopterin-dependent oxidoreductase [Salinisphaera hydrothermalis]KEZ75755.1 oxidoreductase [Salinisphaera hydrothermalis C41B8]
MSEHFFATHFGTYRVDQTSAGPSLSAWEGDPQPTPFGLHYLELAQHRCRVAQPMVRRGWLENNSQSIRGADTFIPMDWDRATRLVAHEIERIARVHGNRSIFAGSYGWASAGRFHHAQSQIKRLLNLAGGFTASRHSYSYGTAGAFLPHVLGQDYAGTNACAPSWDQIAHHTDCLVAFGLRLTNAQCDPGGVGRHTVEQWLTRALDRGMRLIVVSPDRADMPDHPNAEHLAIRPNTDTALMLACAYARIQNDTIDRKQIQRLTTGFDRLAAYVMGDSDGVPKTPAWAADVTGVNRSQIERFIEALRAPTSLLNLGWSLQRATAGEQPYWMAIALAAISGQIGRPGGGFAFGLGSVNSVGQPVRHLKTPGLDQGQNPVADFIPVAAIADLLANPGGTLEYNGRTLPLPDTRMVYWAGGNPFHHHQDLNRLRQAWQRPETIVVHEPVWTATAQHADIVLPSTLPFERNDIAVSSNDRTLVFNRATHAPYAEARDDHQICAMIAAHLRLADEFTEKRETDDWLAHLYAGYRERFPELPDYPTFRERGIHTLDAEQDAPRSTTLLADFAAAPEACPLATPSGRIELFSETIASFGYPDCPPHPSWIAPEEWLGGERAQTYPLHLLSPQPTNRLHSQLDAIGASQYDKVAGREAAVFSREDAEARGIEAGDTVKLFNERGACLVGARVSSTLLRGVVLLPTGAWYTPEDPTDPMTLELAGNPNTLTQDRRSSRLSQGSAAHSCLVEAVRRE